jgi:murein DD-endopeptidase MepM/ murein hydrolase activator NlpD
VHAVFDGQVVDAVDGLSQRLWLHPVSETWAAVRNAIAFARAQRSLDPARLAGNCVIIGSTGKCALYGHLAPGSVTVSKGGAILAGQLVGRVGHTGNSAPHLHFQLMDQADPLTAKGIPCAFAAYLVLREGRWVLVEHGVPERLQRIRSVS